MMSERETRPEVPSSIAHGKAGLPRRRLSPAPRQKNAIPLVRIWACADNIEPRIPKFRIPLRVATP